MFLQEMEDLIHLLSGFDLRMGHCHRIGRIVLDYTGSIEVQHVLLQRPEDQHIFTGIFDKTFLLIFAVQGVNGGFRFQISFSVYPCNPEGKGHRLAEIILFPAQLIAAACQNGKLCITGGINEVIRLQRQHPGLPPGLQRLDVTVFYLGAHDGGVKQQLHTILQTHPVQH